MGVLANWGFSWFPNEGRPSTKCAQLYLKAWEHGIKKKTLRDFWGLCHISYLLSSDFLLIFSKCWHQYIDTARMAGNLCNFPSTLSSFSWVFLKGRIFEVWHQRDDIICHSWTGIVMKWLTDTQESGGGREMASHFIEGCVFENHMLVRRAVLLFTGSRAPDAVRFKRFMEPIYRASTWPSQVIYCVAQEATRLVSMSFSVLPQRSNSITMIKLLNSPAL